MTPTAWLVTFTYPNGDPARTVFLYEDDARAYISDTPTGRVEPLYRAGDLGAEEAALSRVAERATT